MRVRDSMTRKMWNADMTNPIRESHFSIELEVTSKNYMDWNLFPAFEQLGGLSETILA
ncbi:hypothetical protein HUU42_02935 [bacterium]|nr:hypothetical protein [bacterium]